MPAPRPAALGALAICTAAVLWGFDGVVLTPRLANLDVLLVVFLIHAVPFALMQPFLWRTYRRLAQMPWRDWLVLATVAASGGLLGTYSIVRALFLVDFNQLSVVVLLQKLQPLFAILLAAIVLGERISGRFLVRAAIAVAGAYLLTFGARTPDLDTGTATVAAALWAAVAAASFGAATVFGKKMLSTLDFRQTTFGRFGMTTALSLAALLATGTGLPLGELSGLNWAIVVVIGLTTGSGAIFLYYFGLTRVRAVVATVCELCLPLSAILFDYAINGSRLGAWQWLGAATLLTAIALVGGEGESRAE